MTTASTKTRSDPKLSEVARHLVYPEGITTSVFPRIYRRLTDVGVEFDAWQRGFGQLALGCRDSGLYAATIGGIVASWPRQVGKTFTVGNLLIGLCLVFPGFRAVWTSHHGRTTTNTFRSMQSMVRRRKVWPHIKAIRTANGEQEIEFVNGSIIMFGAREQGFGRGMDAIDAVVLDEAQILGLKALEDMVPSTNQSKHPHGALIFFLGTPPRPTDDGEAFTTKRRKAIRGKTANQVYCEFSAEKDTDPDDWSKFHTFNPSFPRRTPLESMLRMRENIPDDDSWCREAMGIWPDDDESILVSPITWRDLRAAGPANDARPTAMAVDMSHGGEIEIAACWITGDQAHAETVWRGRSLAKAIDWTAKNAGHRVPVVIDAASPAIAMVADLEARKVKLIKTYAGDMAAACGLWLDRVIAGTFTHAGQRWVDDALSGAKQRPIRDAGGWGLDRRDSTVNIAPLVSIVLALYGATRSRRVRRDGSTRARTRKAVIG